MELLLALKDAIESDARIDAKQKKLWFDHLVTARKEFYNRWVKEDVHRALFASFQDEAQQLSRNIWTKSRPRSISARSPIR